MARKSMFEGRGRKKSLEDFQREALRAAYTDLDTLVAKYKRESVQFENTKSTQKDSVIRAFYGHRVETLKRAIRNFIRLIYQIEPSLIERKISNRELVLVTSDEIPFYTLRVRVFNADDNRWKPEYMKLYHNAVTGEGAQKGLTVREVKLKYWFDTPWADALLDELLPKHKEEIIAD